MKRLRRIIFNGLATLSLIICLAIAGIWARSYFVHEMVLIFVRNGKGDLCIYRRLIVVNGGIAIHSRSIEGRNFIGSGGEWITRGEFPAVDDFNTCNDEKFVKPGVTYRREAAFKYPTLTPDKYAYSTFLSIAGIQWVKGDVNLGGVKIIRVRSFTFPILVPATFFAVLSIWAFRKRPKQKGGFFCSVCSYDLRATPDRCPECGTIPEKLKV